MKILEQRARRTGILFLINLGSLLGRPVGAGAQGSPPETSLVTTEAFVEKFAERSDLPADADERLSDLRRYCFSAEAEEFRRRLGRGPESLANGLWVLSRHEYTALISTHSQPGATGVQKAAAWRLEQAVQRLLAHAMQTGLVNQELWSLRMLRARSYLEEAQEGGPRRLNPRDVEAAVSAELLEILGPASPEDVNRDIQTSFRNAVTTAEETIVKAVAARLQAIASLRMIYGLRPEASRAHNQQRLAEEESRAFYADERYQRVKDLVQELSPGSVPGASPPPDPAAGAAIDLSIVGRYADLREGLSLGNEPARVVTAKGRPAPQEVESVFGNDQREGPGGEDTTLARIRELIEEKLQIEAPDPASSGDDLEGYRKATEMLAQQLTILVGNAVEAPATGPREQAELERLRQVYPSAPEGDPVPVPWFGTLSKADLQQLFASVKPLLNEEDYQRRLDDRLRHDTEGREFSTELLRSLLQELTQQISGERP